MHLDVFESVWFKLGLKIHTIVLYILILVLDRDLRSQERKKVKTPGETISQSFQWIWMEFGLQYNTV